jgi:hypothetical protein
LTRAGGWTKLAQAAEPVRMHRRCNKQNTLRERSARP